MRAEVREALTRVRCMMRVARDIYRCMYCKADSSHPDTVPHTPTCPLSVLARALEGGEDGA